MADEVKVICPVCEHEVGTKEDGTKVKAHKISGQRCEGSDELVMFSGDETEVSSEGIEKGDPFEALESAQGDPDENDEETDPEQTEEPETAPEGSDEAGQFVHVIKVYNPCHYLADAAWHTSNAKVAAKAAQDAGHVLAGGEAKNTQTEDHGSFSLIHYSVPVK